LPGFCLWLCSGLESFSIYLKMITEFPYLLLLGRSATPYAS